MGPGNHDEKEGSSIFSDAFGRKRSAMVFGVLLSG